MQDALYMIVHERRDEWDLRAMPANDAAGAAFMSFSLSI